VDKPRYNRPITSDRESIANHSPRALHGNAMTTTMGPNNQKQYVTDIQDSTPWLSGKPNAILVSGGGDDGGPIRNLLGLF
jgi:hypothetical protein